MSFPEDLHKKALSFSHETLEYRGHISANYPWLYVDFEMSEPTTIEQLAKMADEFKAICKSEKTLACYDGTFIMGSSIVRFKFIHREELRRLPGDGD